MLRSLPGLKPPRLPQLPPDTKAVSNKVYTYVEQMPQMPGGVGNKAIIEAIQSHVVYPPQALRQALQGQVFVSFVVGEDGVVRDAKIVKGLGGGGDETVLAAVAQLPRFTPGQQAGRPVAVSYTVPINLAISGLPTKQRPRITANTLSIPAKCSTNCWRALEMRYRPTSRL